MIAPMRPRERLPLIFLAFAAFVSLGLPDGLLGVAWPSIRATFRLPLSQLGPLLATSMVGYLISSFTSGQVVARIGIGRLLLISSILVAISLFGYAAAPWWWVMLACGVLAGLGAGAIDAGINAYAAASFSPRLITWLHASYGVGAMLGPLLMAAILSAGLVWRQGYAIMAIALTIMAVCFLFTLDLWNVKQPTSALKLKQNSAGVMDTLRRPIVWSGIALFFIYTGLEVSIGQWSYTLLTDGRGVRPWVAAVWVGIYWGSLAAGRVLFGAASQHISTAALLRFSTLCVPIAAALFWIAPTPLVGFIALALLGLTLAPIFPLLIAATPARLGQTYATQAIGFQVAAACLGTAALPGLAGVLARRQGVQVIAPFILIVALALLVLHEIVVWCARPPAPAFSPEDSFAVNPHIR
jgi:fucose permease